MGDLGALSSLGIGSGVLNYDVIDKLKKADEHLMIDPLKNKLDLDKKREKALSEFITIASTVKTDVMDLADGTLFAKVNTDVSGSSVSVEANDGVKPQTFDINVKQLAKNDVYESNGFDSEDSVVNNTGDEVKLKIGVGDNEATLTLDAGATLSDLRDAINNLGIGIEAKIINTGDNNNPYKLILKATETGKDNIIKFDYGKLEDLGFNQTIYQSKTYDSDSDSVNDSGDTQQFKITINGTTYSMDVDDGESVSDFVDAINNGELKDSDGNALEGVSAKYEDGRIKIHLQQIGDISIDDTNLNTAMNDNTDFTNSNRLQVAQNSIFDYDGVEITRSSNKIEDLITGVTINLNSTGESRVSISTDVDKIVESIKKFVADYNAMVSNIQSLTAFDKDKKTVGLFQGYSEFTSIEPKLSGDMFATTLSYETTKKDLNGNPYTAKGIFSLADLGLSINRNGMMSFDESKFRDSFNSHPDLVERLSKLAFSKVNEDLKQIATGRNSVLNLLDRQIKDEEKSYEDRIDAMNKFLETRYEIMAKQFAAYDEMINNFNAMSSSLNMAIQQAINSKG